jgi:SNF2 family DNA or RNA helicase
MTATATKTVTAELAADGETVLVTFPYNPAFVAAVKKVPSARFVAKDKPEGPAWRLNLDLVTMRKLREKVDPEKSGILVIGEKLNDWGHEAVAKERNLTDLSQADDADLENVPARMVKGCKMQGTKKRFKLRPYQKADIKFMASTNVINANQPGAGKTIETITALFEAGMEWGQHLIFAPVQSLRNVWEREVKQAYSCAGYDEPTILTGDTPDERREAIAEAKHLAEDGKAFWLVLNPAMARLKRTKVEGTEGDNIEYEEQLACPELIEVEWDSITIDEFHLMGLSNPTTMGAKGVNMIAEATQPARRFALSGTPMGGKPIKLWGALHFLNPGEFTSRWNWARHWLVINHNGYGSSIEGIMPGREVDFYNHLKPYLVRRTKREALPGLPPKQRIEVWCDMTKKQEEQYKVFLQEAEWAMEDAEEEGRLTANNILAQYTRLKQFANAYCEVHKTGKVNKETGLDVLSVTATKDSGKLDQLLLKLAEENVIVSGSDDEDEPKCALVASQFNAMVTVVAETLREKGVPVGVISGEVTNAKRNALAKSMQEQTMEPLEALGTRQKQDPMIAKLLADGTPPRVLVFQTMSGTALNLSQADSVHMLDETWVPDNQEQMEDRAHRGDEKTMAKDEVRVYYYRTSKTIEEYVQKLVADKDLNNRTILDLRRRMQKALAEEEAKASRG